MAFLALAFSLLLVPQVAKLAIKIGAVDKPNARKVHTRIMPRMGGLAIYISFFAVLFLSHGLTRQLLGLFLGGTVLVLVGIVDDMKDIPAKVKLCGQLLAACIVRFSRIMTAHLSSVTVGMRQSDLLIRSIDLVPRNTEYTDVHHSISIYMNRSVLFCSMIKDK